FLPRALATLLLLVSPSLSGCTMTVGAVNPTPNVTVRGDGTYSLDVSRVPDTVEAGRGATLTQLRQTLTAGVHNAVGEAFVPNGSGDIRLVIDSFRASIDEGQIGVLRITYKARWENGDGQLLARVAGTALPKNPIQTG